MPAPDVPRKTSPLLATLDLKSAVKMKLCIVLSILSVTGVWYAVSYLHAGEERHTPGSFGHRIEEALVSNKSGSVRSKSFPSPGISSPARLEAIGTVPGESSQDPKGFAAGTVNKPASARHRETARFPHDAITDPLSPGNTLTLNGLRVGIERATFSTDGTALDVVFTPAPGGSDPGEIIPSGLTYEQELFRTKWGWAAFEHVQRAARDQAAAKNP
jgi:hypothetical protein